MTNVCIIGAGSIGTAIGRCLTERSKVRYWDADPERLSARSTLENAAVGARIVIFCVPSWALRAAAASIKPFVGRTAVLVCLSKGLEEGTGLSAPEVLVQVFGKGRAVVFIGGAMLAAEVGAGRGGVCLLAGRVPRARRAVAVLLRGTSVRVEESGDVDGAVLSAVCKNVYAMALGMADGLGWGSNKKGWLAGRAIGEMAGIIRELGGKVGTAQGTAGTGDLLATGFSPHSHHRRMGQELASNGVMSARSEGAESVPQLVRVLGGRAKQFPLLGIIHSALSGTAARNLMDSYYEKIS